MWIAHVARLLLSSGEADGLTFAVGFYGRPGLVLFRWRSGAEHLLRALSGSRPVVTFSPARPSTYMNSDDVPRIAYDQAVLALFYREHVEVVERFVARRVADPHLAADLTADAFLAAIDAAASYDPRRGTPTAWLYGIARNIVSSAHRRAARERSAQALVRGRSLLDEDDIIRLQERIDAEARSREIYAALDALPSGDRAVFELVALDGLSPREAAAAVGISAVSGRVRLHRARVAMRKQIVDFDSRRISQPVEV
jgi:RNA polymerase sigma factor (sigma-70 family)